MTRRPSRSRPTDFTRKAGLAGLLAIPLAAAGVLVGFADVATGRTLLTASGIASLAYGIGLVARHSREPWMKPVFFLYVLSVAIAFLISGVLGGAGAAVTSVLMMAGFLYSGLLPRRAVLLALAGLPIGAVPSVAPVGALLSVAGHAWLAYTLRRESVPHPSLTMATADGGAGRAAGGVDDGGH